MPPNNPPPNLHSNQKPKDSQTKKCKLLAPTNIHCSCRGQKLMLIGKGKGTPIVLVILKFLRFPVIIWAIRRMLLMRWLRFCRIISWNRILDRMILRGILPSRKVSSGIRIRKAISNPILRQGQALIKTKNYMLIKHQFHHLSRIATDLISLLRKKVFNQVQAITILP